MLSRLTWLLRRVVALLAIVLVTLLGIRIYDTQSGLPLEPWHTYVPQELTAEQLDATDWPGYLAAEQTIFDEVRSEVTQKLTPEERVPVNRYFDGSPIYPPATSPRTGTARTSWSRTGRPSVRSCCCTG